MKKFLTYYELLGVQPNATTEEILKAYKEKAKDYHPDKNGGTKVANDMFTYLNQAKECLTNPEMRREYDYLIGVKKRPQKQTPPINPTPVSNDSDVATAIGVGLFCLVVGIAIGSSGK